MSFNVVRLICLVPIKDTMRVSYYDAETRSSGDQSSLNPDFGGCFWVVSERWGAG